MMSRLVISFRFAAAWLVALAAAPHGSPADDTLVSIDGGSVAGQVTAISADGRVSVAGQERAVDLQTLRAIHRTVKAAGRPPAGATILLGGGARILADAFTLADEVCTIKWAYGEALKLKLDAIRGIRLAPAGMKAGDAAFAEALADLKSEDDRLFVIVDENVQSVTGLLDGISKSSVIFELSDVQQTFQRERIFAVALAGILAPRRRPGECLVSLADGSSLVGKVLSLTGGRLTMEADSGVKVELPWDAVTDVAIRSDRLVFLSDLTPAKVIQETITSLPRDWKQDRNVKGGKLIVGETTYPKGLGVQDHTRLTFDRPDQFNVLAATIGMDSVAGQGGDCEFVILGDGRELFRRRVRGGDPPVDVRLDVSGVQSVVLATELKPGTDWSNTFADWCDARFVKAVLEKKEK